MPVLVLGNACWSVELCNFSSRAVEQGGCCAARSSLLQCGAWCNSLPAAVQAKEFGEAEVWMNERLMRAAPRQFAEFVTAFEDRDALARRGAEPLWLVTLYPSNPL